MSNESQHTNRLIDETSPYLLQHARNPVDWWPWCEEAIGKAQSEDKPIFLSIGYAACHWCHVMEHESFENEAIAKILNENFVAIKVDREERPDLDDIYMKSVQMMTGSGGWPMSVFLTPDLKPFYGGTYFPPDNRYGRPGFGSLLLSITEAWQKRRDDVINQSDQLAGFIRRSSDVVARPDKPNYILIDRAFDELSRAFDSRYGGFGGAPKFPHSMDLMLLMRYFARNRKDEAVNMVRLSLDKMARGGMYDQLGGGFHRYSTDAQWLTPHFEKMLYDNALLARAYLESYQLTGGEYHKRIATEILDYVLKEMTSPEGGFYSSTDADSEGVEGKFFVWTPQQIEEVLGAADAKVVCAYWDVTGSGNFEHGQSILNVPRDEESVAKLLDISVSELNTIMERSRPRLYEARKRRVPPGLDDKILTSWNGLMIGALAFGAKTLDDTRYRVAAEKAAEFVLRELYKEGRLLASYRAGRAKLNGYLTDYAYLAGALIDLYEAAFDVKWLNAAVDLTDKALELFWDEEEGGLFFTSHDHEQLIARLKDSYDGAQPSGNSYFALDLLRLAGLTGNDAYRGKAEGIFKAFRNPMEQSPMGFSLMLCALDFFLGNPKEIVLAGDVSSGEGREMLRLIRERFLPNKVVALNNGPGAVKAMPPLDGKVAKDGQLTVYVCENRTCKEPVIDAKSLRGALGIE